MTKNNVIVLLTRKGGLLGRKDAFLDVIAKFQLRPGSELEIQFCREQVAEINDRIKAIDEEIARLDEVKA